MGHKSLTASLLGIGILAGGGMLSAQSLGDIARQERAKHETHPPAKVWTNDNMPRAARIEPAPTSPEPIAQTQSAPPAASGGAPALETPPAGSKSPEDDKKHTQEYWQALFKTARAQLADAQERQRLVEDELSLLQIQQARELDPAANKELGAKVTAKSAAVEEARSVTAKAEKALDDLQKEFDASGAPAEWSKTDQQL
ncbi:MAG: hypothetical protein DMG21_12160 [Acidobacteria bacterium]|nr:MAG: hypothetical protein DMG21_12160 [Acidobacteriota bacterium]